MPKGNRRCLPDSPAMVALSAMVAIASLTADAQQSQSQPDDWHLNVLQGRVLNPADKRPVSGAAVVVADAEQGRVSYAGPTTLFFNDEVPILSFPLEPNQRGAARTTTDQEGRFVIKGLRPGRFNIIAVHPELGVAIVTNVTQPNFDKPFDITLSPPTFVEGTIRGLPRVDVRLRGYFEPAELPPWILSQDRGDPRITTRLDLPISDTGKFRVGPLPVGGTWSLRIEQPMPTRRSLATLLTLPVEVSPSRTLKFDFDLNDGLETNGRVLGPSGHLLPEVSLLFTKSDDKPVARRFGAISRADGSYRVRGMVPGTYIVKATRRVRRNDPG